MWCSKTTFGAASRITLSIFLRPCRANCVSCAIKPLDDSKKIVVTKLGAAVWRGEETLQITPMLRQLGSRLAPRLTPGAAACLQEVQCGFHSSASQCGVGIPERRVPADKMGENEIPLRGAMCSIDLHFSSRLWRKLPSQ